MSRRGAAPVSSFGSDGSVGSGGPDASKAHVSRLAPPLSRRRFVTSTCRRRASRRARSSTADVGVVVIGVLASASSRFRACQRRRLEKQPKCGALPDNRAGHSTRCSPRASPPWWIECVTLDAVVRQRRTSSPRTKWIVAAIAAVLVAAISLVNSSRASTHSLPSRPPVTGTSTDSSTEIGRGGSASNGAAPNGQPSNRADPRLRRIGFASRRGLESHWQKHGAEFGNPSLERYLSMAQDLRDAPLSSKVIEAPQSNGSYARFDRTTGAFLAFNRDLTIRTFFRPNDGETYFRRAIHR